MKQYLRVYKRLWYMSWQTLLVYRANFVNSLIASLSWGIFSIVSILLLTSNTNSVYGWSKTEILLLTCTYQILIGIFHALFSQNFERMAEIINLGQLDSLLVKPIDSQFSLSMWRVNYTSFIRIIVGIIAVVYFLNSGIATITPLILIFFGLLLFAGILLLYAIWFIVTTIIIWFPRLSNLVELLYTISSISRYPGEVYKNALGIGFYFLVPLIIIITTPVRFLVSHATIFDLSLMFLFSGIFLLISRKFWKFALRFYTSASS